MARLLKDRMTVTNVTSIHNGSFNLMFVIQVVMACIESERMKRLGNGY